MKILRPSRIPLSVRAKILVLFLALALAALAITGYVAFSAISDMGLYAEGSSATLGLGVVNSSSHALTILGESYLERIAADQANYTDSLFEDTDSEMDILSSQAAELEHNPPISSSVPTFTEARPPADPYEGPMLLFAPNATAIPGSPEALALTGLAANLKAVYSTDTEMTSVYVATDSGMMLYYPGSGKLPDGYDPRLREWFTGAKPGQGVVWSTAPYVDAMSNGLVLTSSEAVTGPGYGKWVVGSDVSATTINQDFIGQSLGANAYAVLINRDGDVISRPGLSPGNTSWNEPFSQENAFTIDNTGIRAVAENMTAGKTGIGNVLFNGTPLYVAYAPVRSMNWSLAVAVPESEITGPVDVLTGSITRATRDTGSHITGETGWLSLVFSVLFLIILAGVFLVSVFLSRVITRPVSTLKEGATTFGSGNLDFRINIESGDEFEELARSFNSMANALQENIRNLRETTAEKERYAKELEIARTIQTSFLPEKMPEIPGFDVAAVMIPAMEVGGDFYDIIPAAGGNWAFVIADVSGKGVSAALFMAMSRTLLRGSIEGAKDVIGALGTANGMITRNSPASMFVTVYGALLDPEKRIITGINAGHNPPLIIRGGSGQAQFLHESGIAMGVVEEMQGTPESVLLEPGDLLVMYTDGVTEAFDPEFNAFGEGRLVRLALECRDLTASMTLAKILAGIREFTGPAPQSDDITLIVIRVSPDRQL